MSIFSASASLGKASHQIIGALGQVNAIPILGA